MVVKIFLASDDAASGSLMAKQERISPISRGSNHSLRWAGVANRLSNSILPVSGALQLNTSEAQGIRPMISASGAYSTLVRRWPG